MPNQSPFRPAEVNPYAAPLSDEAVVAQLVNERTMWRDGPTLVVPREAVLPNRCVKCNAPAERRLIRRLYWHHPAFYLLILVSIWIYIIVALLVRKKAVIDVGLCARHHAQRRRSILICWVILLMCIAGFIASTQLHRDYSWLFWSCLFVFVGDLIYAAVIQRLIVPKCIDNEYAWLRKIHPDFLAEFPLLTG